MNGIEHERTIEEGEGYFVSLKRVLGKKIVHCMYTSEVPVDLGKTIEHAPYTGTDPEGSREVFKKIIIAYCKDDRIYKDTEETLLQLLDWLA